MPRVKLVQQKRRVCSNIPRIIETIVTEDECRDVEKEVCRDITRTEQQQECKQVPVKLCRWVIKKVEVEVEEKVCRKVVKNKCEDVEQKIVVNVPREMKEKQCRKVNKTVCKNVQVILLACHSNFITSCQLCRCPLRRRFANPSPEKCARLSLLRNARMLNKM